MCGTYTCKSCCGTSKRAGTAPSAGGLQGRAGARAAFGISTSFYLTLGVVSYSDFTTVKMHLEFLVPLVLVCNNYLALTLLTLSCDSGVIQGQLNPPSGLLLTYC